MVGSLVSRRGPASWRRAEAASRLLVGVVCVILAGSGAETGARERKTATPDQPPTEEGRSDRHSKPRVQLSASVQAGFAPLTIQFTARLRNVAVDDAAFCHAGTMLALRKGNDEEQELVGEDPACLHPPGEVHVPLNTSRTFTVDRSGYYEFIFIVRTNDGRRLVSNAVPVRVLSSPGGR
jgi:hypothetical protein